MKTFKGEHLMSKKSLLTEAEMRRFMGLAGLTGPQINSLTETVYENEMEEDLYQEEAAAEPEELENPVGVEADEPAEMDAMEPMDEPEDAAGPDADPLAGIAEEDKEAMAQAVIQTIGDALGLDIDVSAGEEAEEIEPAEMEGDEPEMMEGDHAMEEDDMMEDLDNAGVSMELSEEEIVQEVARRVAKRILKANKANKALAEALGLDKVNTRSKK
jgi:hypothetical protein